MVRWLVGINCQPALPSTVRGGSSFRAPEMVLALEIMWGDASDEVLALDA